MKMDNQQVKQIDQEIYRISIKLLTMAKECTADDTTLSSIMAKRFEELKPFAPYPYNDTQ